MKLPPDIEESERARALAAADACLSREPVTITAFPAPRSAGGLHDFFSEGDYWWSNPDDPDGPYIQRDGETNPDNFVAHRQAMIGMSMQVAALAAACKISGEQRYARQAIRHLRAWFVDAPARMNPHLAYAQAIHGITTGRGIGIIDTIHLVEVARAVAIVEEASGDLDPVRDWFAAYLRWIATSENGKQERDAANNHGACWVMQAAAFAALLGEETMLAYCRARFRNVLLPGQMAPDGSFPRELKRTKPYGYSLFNLDAMATICRILDENLWSYATPDGRGLRRGIAFLYPYIRDKSRWPYAPDVMFFEHWPVRSPALLFAGLAYDAPKYLDLWKTLDANPTNPEVLRNLPIRQPLLWVD